MTVTILIRKHNQSMRLFEPGAVDGTDNTYELIKRLSGKSKIIITTIQKLNCAVTRDAYNKHLQDVKNRESSDDIR